MMDMTCQCSTKYMFVRAWTVVCVTCEELLTIIFEGLDHSVHGLRLVVVEA